MVGHDVTRGIPDGALLLAVYPGTNLTKADFPDSVPPRVASICGKLLCRLISISYSVPSLMTIVQK